MNLLSKNQYFAACLALVFLVSFIVAFFTISIMQSAYSTPSSYASVIDGMDISVGPPPNSTGVSLDATITVEALASASLNDLRMTPKVNFASVTSDSTGPLTYRTSFHPDKLLKPSTSYNVSVTIMNVPIQWSFTTTSQPFQPGTSYYLATNALLIALSAAAFTTTIAGFSLWLKRKQT
jgi:hypothetical protein